MDPICSLWRNVQRQSPASRIINNKSLIHLIFSYIPAEAATIHPSFYHDRQLVVLRKKQLVNYLSKRSFQELYDVLFKTRDCFPKCKKSLPFEVFKAHYRFFQEFRKSDEEYPLESFLIVTCQAVRSNYIEFVVDSIKMFFLLRANYMQDMTLLHCLEFDRSEIFEKILDTRLSEQLNLQSLAITAIGMNAIRTFERLIQYPVNPDRLSLIGGSIIRTENFTGYCILKRNGYIDERALIQLLEVSIRVSSSLPFFQKLLTSRLLSSDLRGQLLIHATRVEAKKEFREAILDSGPIPFEMIEIAHHIDRQNKLEQLSDVCKLFLVAALALYACVVFVFMNEFFELVVLGRHRHYRILNF